MFNVMNKIDGNMYTIYDVKIIGNHTYFLIYNSKCEKWLWKNVDCFEPIGTTC